MAYPTATELKNLLLGAGLITDPNATPDSYFDYSGAVDAAVADWENRCGYVPFVKDSSDVTRYFDPPQGRRLLLGAGLMTLTSVTSNGAALTENTDFWLLPANGAAESLPYDEIEFSARQAGLPRSIVIVGKWGRVTSVPADVKRGVLCKAASLLAGEILLGASQGGLAMWKEGDVEQRYDLSKTTACKEGWDKVYRDLLMSRYVRRTIA